MSLFGSTKESQEIKLSYGPNESNGNHVVFYPESHSYFLNNDHNKKLKSVTTLLHGLFPPFDAEKVAKKIEKKRGQSWQDIVEEWRKEGEYSSKLGTAVHFYAEVLLKSGRVDAIQINEVPEDHQKYLLALKEYIPKLLEKFEFLDSEKIIFSEKYGLAGTVDLLMVSRKTGNLVLLDWKTNKEIKNSNQWQRGLPPISHLEDCNYNHYSLQLSTYKKILIEEGYISNGKSVDCALIHLQKIQDNLVTPRFIPTKNLSREVELIFDINLKEELNGQEKTR